MDYSITKYITKDAKINTRDTKYNELKNRCL